MKETSALSWLTGNKHRDDFFPVKVKAVGNGTRGSQPGALGMAWPEGFFAMRDCPVHCRIFSRALLDSGLLAPVCDNQKGLPDAVKGPLWGQSHMQWSLTETDEGVGVPGCLGSSLLLIWKGLDFQNGNRITGGSVKVTGLSMIKFK